MTLLADLERVIAAEKLSKGNGCDVEASDDSGFWCVSMTTPYPKGGTGFLCGMEAFNEEDARFVAIAVNFFRKYAKDPELLAAVRNDARYRVLRDAPAGTVPACGIQCLDGPYFNKQISGDELDAAIDKARGAEMGGG